MRTILFCTLTLAFLCRQAWAQAPESGRWQELRFASADMLAQSEDRYSDAVIDLAATGQLDDDRALLHRLHVISAGLIRAAIAMKPESAQWQWEVHTTSDPRIDATCMAGGKILVGTRFVQRLMLEDGELATLLAHEIAHAVAEHQRETLSEALRYAPQLADALDVMMERYDTDLSLQLRLAALSNLQEREADQIGMVLAHRAGWAAAAMVTFYRKLAAIESASLLSSAHPAAASRLSMARGMLRLFSD